MSCCAQASLCNNACSSFVVNDASSVCSVHYKEMGPKKGVPATGAAHLQQWAVCL